MTDKETQNTARGLPLGRVFQLKDLPGWLGKRLVVPPGRLGLAIQKDGSLLRTFPPGEHQLLSDWQRLQGQGLGLLAGYVPDLPFNDTLNKDYLLSGDRELLDARLVYSLECANPLRFFNEFVLPRGELYEGDLQIDPRILQDVLAPQLVQYAAADLAQGRINQRLIAQLQVGLTPALEKLGLRLKEIGLLAISRSDNRALIAEKAQQLAERLKSVELQAKMADIENQAELEDFIRQFAADMPQVTGLGAPDPQSRPEKSIESQPASPPAEPQKGNSLILLVNSQTQESEEKNFYLLTEQFNNSKPTDKPDTKRKVVLIPLEMWVPGVASIAAVVLAGLLMTWVVDRVFGVNTGHDKLIGTIWNSVIAVIWSAVFGGITFLLRKLIKGSMTYTEEVLKQQRTHRLEDLVGHDRRWADEFVRKQCAQELKHVQQVLEDIRGKEYQRGKTDLALRLRNDLERSLDDWSVKVQRPDFGQPPYVSDLNINRQAWKQMLTLDESLLEHVQSLHEEADQLQQASIANQLTDQMLTNLQAKIANFGNRFFTRGRALYRQTADNPA